MSRLSAGKGQGRGSSIDRVGLRLPQSRLTPSPHKGEGNGRGSFMSADLWKQQAAERALRLSSRTA